MKSRLWAAMATWISLAMASALAVLAQEPDAPSEQQIKAAFLFNFAKFIDWPPEAFSGPEAPYVIGVFGETPFGSDLERAVENKRIADRAIVIRQIEELAALKLCHIVFVSSPERRRLEEVFAALKGASVLTVGESPRFVQAGGMIRLYLERNKVRFQINDAAARSAGLKISSKLLSLSKTPRSEQR